jgi:hypothetical protein
VSTLIPTTLVGIGVSLLPDDLRLPIGMIVGGLFWFQGWAATVVLKRIRGGGK